MIKVQDLERLATQCFNLETQLPLWKVSEEPSSEAELRRELYKIRCDLGAIIYRIKLDVYTKEDKNETTNCK